MICFRNIQKFTTIDAFSSSSLVTRLTTDISNVQMAFMMLIRMAVALLSCLLQHLLLATAFYHGADGLQSFCCCRTPIGELVSTSLFLRVIPLFKKRSLKVRRTQWETAEENLAGIRVVKSFVNETLSVRNLIMCAAEDLL